MRVLLVVHGFPPAAAGGTEIYTRNLGHALAAQGAEVCVLTREDNPCRPEYSVRHGRDGDIRVTWINNTFAASTSFEDSCANPALLRRVEAELEAIAPDVLHVQHLTCLSTGIPEAAARRGIPVVMTLNDYWLICHRGQLFTPDGRRCDGPFKGGCDACLPATAAAGPGLTRAARWIASTRLPGAASLLSGAARALDVTTSAPRACRNSAARLQQMREAMRHVDLFLAPSDTMQGMFRRFGLPSHKLRRCEQGVPLLAPARPDARPWSPLRVGFAGAFIPSKAPHLLLQAVASLSAGAVEVRLFGDYLPYHGDTSYPLTLEPLIARARAHRAAVPHRSMAAALAELDVLVVPSIWIENAPFVIREAFAAGTPVIAANLGGMAEMVRDGVDGLLFQPGDPTALAAVLQRLLDEPGLLDRLREGIRRPMAIGDDAAALCAVFREVGAGRGAPRSSSTSLSGVPGDVCAVVLNYRTPEQTWLAVNALQASRRRPDSIVVVDNGSGDGSASLLRDALDDTIVVETDRNLGFSGGCNTGIARGLDAGAGFVLLVNSDAVLHPDAIGRLHRAARDAPRAGILAPLLLSREEPDRIASAGIRFTPRTGRMVHLAAGRRLGQFVARGVAEVDAVSGCVMLVRTEVFRAVGFLDEEYFFSFEDVDFCLRARAAGFRVVSVDDAVAYHAGASTIGSRSPARVYFATRNHLRLGARQSSPLQPPRALRAMLIVGFNLAYVVRSPEVPTLAGLRAVARGTWHYLVGRYGPDG